MAVARRQSLWVLAGAALVVSGCANPAPKPDFHSTDIEARLEAIRLAGASGDRSKLPDLISRLDSDDPAERLLTIRTLERLTGQTLGYEYSDPQTERSQAVSRWVSWYARTGPPAGAT